MSEQNWRMKLRDVRELKSQGAILIYQRMNLLIQISRDQDFQNHCKHHELSELDELDKELDDVGFDFLTLMKTMERFPQEDEWSKRSISVLVAEAVEKKKYNREHAGTSWKDRYMQAQKEIDRLRHQLDISEARIEELEKVLLTPRKVNVS